MGRALRYQELKELTMKITNVRARTFEWKGKTVPPQGNFCSNAMDLLYSKQETMSTFRFHGWTVVEIETDNGLVGYGNVALAPRISKQIVDQYLKPLVMGQDPWDYEYLNQRMYRGDPRLGPQGRRHGGDLGGGHRDLGPAGQEVGKPVFKLLGGRTKEKIPCYYSKLYRTDLKAMQDEAKTYLDQGFTAFKMRFGYGPQHLQKGVVENLKSVEAVREVIGYDNDLMLECYMGWNVEYAKRMLPKLEKFQPRWLEEPVIADDIDGYAELNGMNIVPISGGEHEFSLLRLQAAARAQGGERGAVRHQPRRRHHDGAQDQRAVRGLQRAGDPARRPDAQLPPDHEHAGLADERVLPDVRRRGRQRAVLLHLRRRAGGRERLPAAGRRQARPRADAEDRVPRPVRHHRVTHDTRPDYRGVFPVVPTTFTESGELDLPSQKRCVDFMIDAG